MALFCCFFFLYFWFWFFLCYSYAGINNKSNKQSTNCHYTEQPTICYTHSCKFNFTTHFSTTSPLLFLYQHYFLRLFLLLLRGIMGAGCWVLGAICYVVRACARLCIVCCVLYVFCVSRNKCNHFVKHNIFLCCKSQQQ